MATSPLRGNVQFTNTQPTEQDLAQLEGPMGEASKGFIGSVRGMSADSYAQEALAAEMRNDAAAKDAALLRNSQLRGQIAEKYTPRVTSLKDINNGTDLGDWAAGTLGGAAATMLPSVAGAALTRGRGNFGKATAFAGAYAPSYLMERNEAIGNQYQDPEQLKASAQDRASTASMKGGVNAALESIVPAGIGGALLRKPAGSFLGHVGREAVTEGATEAAQEGVGFLAQKHLNQNLQLDPQSLIDAAAGGALGGAGMSAAGRAPSHAVQGLLNGGRGAVVDGAQAALDLGGQAVDKARALGGQAVDGAVNLGGQAMDSAVDLGGQVADAAQTAKDSIGQKLGDLGGAMNERFDVGDKASNAKDAIGQTIDRMTDAVKTSQNPSEFMSKVFGSSIDEQAAHDLDDASPDTLRGTTFEETEANMAADEAGRAQRAQRYAENLMADPATPASIKQRVSEMGEDFSDVANQKYVARTLAAQRAGEKFKGAVDGAVEAASGLFKAGVGKAADLASTAEDTLEDRIIKKNLQSATPDEHNAYGKVIFDGLTDTAKADGYVRAQLGKVTNALMAFAAKTGDMTPKDVQALTKISDVMGMFKDPDAMIEQLVEYANLPRTEDSFLARIKNISSAQNDIKQPNSFLQSSMTLDAQEQLKGSDLGRLAKMVDGFGNQSLSKKDSDTMIAGLASVFGSEDAARTVLDYYAKENQSNLKFDEHEGLVGADATMGEVDAPQGVYRFKDAKSMRPFFNGSKDIDHTKADGTLGEDSKQTKTSYAEYTKERGLDPRKEVERILDDIAKRGAAHKARTNEDRTEQINALRGEYSMVNSMYHNEGAEAALDLYSVLKAEGVEPNNLKATDEDLKAYATDPSGTRVTFTKTDGKKLMLNASSMWKGFGDKEKGTVSGGSEGYTERSRRLFKEAVASVLARDDIAGLDTDINGIKIDKDGGVLNEVLKPAELKAVQDAMTASDVSVEQLKKATDSMVLAYQNPEFTKYDRADMRRHLDGRVKEGAKLIDSSKSAPQRAVLNRKLEVYKNAVEQLKEIETGFETVGDLVDTAESVSRLRTEMDTSKNVRRTEEDTGAELGTGGAPSMKAPAKKDLPNPAKSSRAQAAKINDTRALSEDALDAMYDVAVGENWDRLDTPNKVLKFAEMAVKAKDQLAKTDALALTDVMDELKYALDKMLRGGKSFNWDSLLSEVEATPEHKEALQKILGAAQGGSPRPKAEPGQARQSSMQPKRGRPAKVDRKAVIDEIARIRGNQIGVIFDTFANLGKSSGSYEKRTFKDGSVERTISVATNSLNPMSVAWHESLHDFMAMLTGDKETRDIKGALLKSADSPQLMQRLKGLLKDHPEALEQITHDREERLAYMYQFWAEGVLPLGHANKNVFERIAKLIRDVLGIVSQEQKTAMIFEALHDGKLAEPSTVAYVIQDLKAETLGDKIREYAAPIANASQAVFTGATDRLRDTNVDALGQLADMFHREPGLEKSGELPFLQRRAQSVGKNLNSLESVLTGTTATERAQALENFHLMKTPTTKLEKDIAAYLQGLHDYMVERGVLQYDAKNKVWGPIGHLKDYFPRVWDKNVIRNNETEFRNLIGAHTGAKQARDIFEAITNGDGSLELVENEHSLGFTPWVPAILNRKLDFINPSNAALFAKFQSKDMTSVLTSYTQRAVHRAEYAHSFGNNGEEITKLMLKAQKQGATVEEIKMAQKASMAMEGTLGHDFNPKLKEIMSGIMTYQNVVLLPLSLFSNLIDPLGVAMRSNSMKEAWGAFKYGMQGLANQIRGAKDDDATDLARTIGLIDDQNMLDSMGQVYNSMYMSTFMKNINQKFFRYNGMEMWNQRMRVAGMMASHRFIIKHADAMQNGEGDTSQSERYMAELGLSPTDVFSKVDGTLAMTRDELLAAGAKPSGVDELEKRVQAAVFKWVDGAVLRPNAAHRPIWGSDPRFALIFHLKQFTFSFHSTILRRVNEEFKHGNNAPTLILASYVPFMFLADVLKGSLTGTINSTTNLWDVAANSVNRSGILGVGAFGTDAWDDIQRGKLPGESFMGPAFGNMTTVFDGLSGFGTGEQVLDRSIPGHKFL